MERVGVNHVWAQSLGHLKCSGEKRAGDFCHESHLCSMTVNMASLLEQALATLVKTFQEYSQFSGNSLCQAGFKELLEEKELPTWAPVSTWAEPPGSTA